MVTIAADGGGNIRIADNISVRGRQQAAVAKTWRDHCLTQLSLNHIGQKMIEITTHMDH